MAFDSSGPREPTSRMTTYSSSCRRQARRQCPNGQPAEDETFLIGYWIVTQTSSGWPHGAASCSFGGGQSILWFRTAGSPVRRVCPCQPDGLPPTTQLLPEDFNRAHNTAGLVPVLPVDSSTLNITLPEPADFTDGRAPVTSVLLKRRNIPATPALAVTGWHTCPRWAAFNGRGGGGRE
ncbi:hypothetical protein VOLCADRAFT_100025 [Volvox carteri f. nagariensis]|uniref:Uncharacterized protein n=1 Tax=Volvox carteri f. nagariensis TaxID=3068 RepID=D8UJ82_VOLCA|nr:uncharacterized protein VOLCADRAFT_100025 [Volvox carteri f. nagariensis]EFJ40228.1 hypothetical protein VOLCADRAFT_100025 [Volvox carteri f. nagariensis]|eukprot:XP_002958708.1 hypothetical protein VOLCADRAFT_100025 [Volvox carteri f. nagariensis]